MMRTPVTIRIVTFLFLAGFTLSSTGCDILQNTFQQPTMRIFPTLTPFPTHTVTVTATSTPTSIFTPTIVTPVKESTPLSLSIQPIHAENAVDLELIASFGKGIPQQMVVSPDGSILAVSTTHGVFLYDAINLHLKLALITNEIQHSLAFSPDGNQIASGSSLGEIRVWAVDDGELMSTWAGNQPVLALSYSSDGKQLASSSWDGVVRIWQVGTGKVQRSFPVRLRVVRSLSFSPDGEFLYGWAYNESVQVWRLSDGNEMQEIYIGKDERGQNPYGGAFSQDGTIFASNHGLRIRVFQTRNGTTMWLIRDIEKPVENITISPTGRFLAAKEQGTIKIWDLETGKQVTQIKLPLMETGRHLLTFSSNEDVLITLGDSLMRWVFPAPNDEISIIENPNGAGIQEFTNSIMHGSQAFEDDFYLATLKGRLDAYDVSAGQQAQLLPASGDEILSFAIAPDQKTVAFGTSNGRVILLDINNDPLLNLDAHQGPVRSLAFSHEGKQLATGGDDDQVLIWQLDNGTLVARFEVSSAPQDITFLPDGNSLLVRVREGVTLWSLTDAAIQHIFPGYTFTVSRDGKMIALASSTPDGDVVNLYRLPSGSLVSSLPLNGNRLALSPDHSILVMAGEDIIIWRTVDGALMQTLADIKLFGEICFSPDGNWLVLSVWDGALRFWGVPLDQ